MDIEIPIDAADHIPKLIHVINEVEKEKQHYMNVLRQIEDHIRSTPYPIDYIVRTLRESLPEHQTADYVSRPPEYAKTTFLFFII